jgi:hypothetical protein
MAFRVCGALVTVSWNKPDKANKMISVWMSAYIGEYHPSTDFECHYGDGFQILEQGKAPPKTLEEQRTHLATLWDQYPVKRLNGFWNKYRNPKHTK